MADFIMPVAFSFSVNVTGADGHEDMQFQEVSGLEAEIELETVVEGGENRFVHKLPKAVKHPNLVLKRGIAGKQSELMIWCQDVLQKDFSKPIVPRSIYISLLNEDADPIRSWSVERAYPVKWNVSTLNAMENKIAIETMEFAYTILKRTA